MPSTPNYEHKTRPPPKKIQKNCSDLSGFRTLNLNNPKDFPNRGGPPSLSPANSQDSESNNSPLTPDSQFSAANRHTAGISPPTVNHSAINQPQHLPPDGPHQHHMPQNYPAPYYQSNQPAKYTVQPAYPAGNIAFVPNQAPTHFSPPLHPHAGNPAYLTQQILGGQNLVPTFTPSHRQVTYQQPGSPHVGSYHNPSHEVVYNFPNYEPYIGTNGNKGGN